jgi:hypothetical protein
MTIATGGESPLISARRPVRRAYYAALLAALLAYETDILVSGTGTAGVWRQLTAAVLSVAGAAALGWARATQTSATRAALGAYLGDQASAQWRSTRQLRALARQETAARYGPAAAVHARRARRALSFALTALEAMVLFFLAYVNFYRGDLPALAVFLAAIGVSVPARVIGRRDIKRTNTAVSEATGVHEQAPAPRWQAEEYEAWCQANDVQPYAHGRPPGPT